jgi:hypothetical protein
VGSQARYSSALIDGRSGKATIMRSRIKYVSRIARIYPFKQQQTVNVLLSNYLKQADGLSIAITENGKQIAVCD